MSVILAVDEGTTNVKAVALDPAGTVLASASQPLAITNTAVGWTEQDAREIWQSTLEVLGRVAAQVRGSEIAGVAISNQRESVVAWDRRTGAPTGPVLSWQDTRTARRCEALVPEHGRRVAEITGLPLNPMFSAPKMAWLLEHSPNQTIVGTVDSWLVWNLTGGERHVIEAGNASRTLLLDLESVEWRPELMSIFGISGDVLPSVVATTGDFGLTRCAGLPEGLPILAVMADSHAALRGHGGGDPGVVKATYGTGTSVVQGTGAELRRAEGLASTLAWYDDGPVYAVEGNVRYSGSALDWTARLLGCADAKALGVLAGEVMSADGAVLVPAFGGLGAPYWDASAVGIIAGLGAGSTGAHVARAAFDAVAHQVADVIELMSVGSELPDEIRADGGATASTLLMQTQADTVGSDVVVVGDADVALRGVAALAFGRIGVAMSDVEPSRRFTPEASESERAEARRSWADAITRSRG
ncbi:FGGY family carbohydrate kinase [Demequina sp. NBRC 110052]|uniref:FGGY family carbohydrate kinase n=1 Tax=Demequina sp. NBRC 110052 TaxID=1570341 RepID=UPI000A0075E0|nr:FGGY family carbohydrate kinase [Demequina sp. NBRC 110052]